LLDDLMENPMVPAGAAGVVVLLAAFGFYRLRQRRTGGAAAAGVDSSFLESRLQPDSFFGASGGQRIDTKDGALSGSSMVYSPSQLEAAGDVDPVAEADVYLAYGRDLQAEEILKEAIRTQPDRVSVRVKLLEIYAKRRDARGFEALAAETYGLAGADSPDWERVREMGIELEPANPLYQPGAAPTATAPRASTRANGEPSPSILSPSTLPNPFSSTSPQQPEAVAPPDIDLDLDFSLPDEPAPAPVSAASMASTQPLTLDVSPAQAVPDISFDIDAPASEPTVKMAPSGDVSASEPTVKMAASAEPAPLDFDAGLSFDLPAATPSAAPAPAPSAPADDGNALSFDLGGISLDLPASPAAASSSVSAGDVGSEADTKLALADEFRQIGDIEAARQLVSEVIASASGDLKAKAQRLLSELG
jgi:pilus assembly protein FimV